MVSSKILPRSKRGFWEEHVSLKAVQSSSNMSKNFINDALVSFIFISRASCQLQQLIFWRSLINWPTLTLSKFHLCISFSFYEEFVQWEAQKLCKKTWYICYYVTWKSFCISICWKNISISVSDCGVILVGEVICGIREVE